MHKLGGEPDLDDMLRDPIFGQVMKSHRVSKADVLDLCRQTSERLRRRNETRSR